AAAGRRPGPARDRPAGRPPGPRVHARLLPRLPRPAVLGGAGAPAHRPRDRGPRGGPAPAGRRPGRTGRGEGVRRHAGQHVRRERARRAASVGPRAEGVTAGALPVPDPGTRSADILEVPRTPRVPRRPCGARPPHHPSTGPVAGAADRPGGRTWQAPSPSPKASPTRPSTT